jgi:hypothetical protein
MYLVWTIRALKRVLNGLKRSSVRDAQHPSGFISFLTFWGLHGHNVICALTWFYYHHTTTKWQHLSKNKKKTKKKRLPNNLFPIKQRKTLPMCVSSAMTTSMQKAKGKTITIKKVRPKSEICHYLHLW